MPVTTSCLPFGTLHLRKRSASSPQSSHSCQRGSCLSFASSLRYWFSARENLSSLVPDANSVISGDLPRFPTIVMVFMIYLLLKLGRSPLFTSETLPTLPV